ncbi:alpha/beta fold hydrolase [Roseivivax sp.]
MPRDAETGGGARAENTTGAVHRITLGAPRGQGAPALALHCALAHSGAWGGLAERLGDRLSIAAPDMPGHGRSAPWSGPGPESFHDQVTAIGAEHLEPGLTLLGHSFGATVALRLAEDHPDKIRRMVLVEPVLFAAARARAPELFEARRAAGRPMIEALEADDLDRAGRVFTATWGAGRPWDEMGPRARAQIGRQMRIVGETQATLNEDAAGLLAPGRLEACALPVLLVRGETTEPILAEIHAELLARLPEAREVVIPGAGHMAPITHPEEVAAEVRAFLDAT